MTKDVQPPALIGQAGALQALVDMVYLLLVSPVLTELSTISKYDAT